MVTNEQVLAVVTTLQATQTTISNDVNTILADIAASKEAGTPVSDETFASLQSVATTLASSVASIDAAINPPAAPVEETPAP